MNNMEPIAIIDSGVGGLTVAREVMRKLPLAPILYFGDNARCPYGSKPPEEIRACTFQMIEFVSAFPLQALVIACNTATAVVLEEAKNVLPYPVIGVIEPGARAALAATKNGRIGVIGTETTIRTGAYEAAIKRLSPAADVVGLACPAFVPLVERNGQHAEQARQEVSRTLSVLRDCQLDTLILGCTHYPLLAPLIQEAMGAEVQLISSAEETASELAGLIGSSPLAGEQTSPRHRFFTSGDAEHFQQIAEEWLGASIRVETQSLEGQFQS
ncbi:glutamate racemase [Brevibacillus composti]|uniref:Glutamate racemase n=1 Tax=Brevibacillus composti TaxID=2796470 RepID=A0A7T5EIV6_9BACL|nr:glutamate racemase [Brevibacillus composti]QQE73340.1 glutamate racemase [Brevibacillus composti]QUO40421.1 glutamate racemase [Brevibacillus composti]